MNYNKVILAGRLTRDPEIRYTPTTGDAVANFTLASNRPFKNAQGDYDADFVPIVVWRKKAEAVGNYLKKGSIALVEGRLQVRTYEDKEGQRRWITEVVADRVEFGPRKNNGNNKNGTEVEISEDDVPF